MLKKDTGQDFVNIMSNNDNGFSRVGAMVLLSMIGEQIELDPIVLRSQYSELNLKDAMKAYCYFEEECEDIVEVLEEHTVTSDVFKDEHGVDKIIIQVFTI